MIRISNIKYPIQLSVENLPEFVAKKYNIKSIKDFRIVKESVDARKKNDIHYVYTVDIATDNEDKLIRKNKNFSKPVYNKYRLPQINGNSKTVVVAGFGPAGIMCSYALCKMGYKVVVIERGEAVEDRVKSVNRLKTDGILNPESNIQFGEGGAGTFSDGKLTTGVNDSRIGYVLDEFVRHGAPREILYRAKPHIGTDNLLGMVKSFREDIISGGGEVRFSHKLTDIILKNGRVAAVKVNNGDEIYEIKTDNLVIATGHSARDVFALLKQKGANLNRKVFAVGARIEHLQSDIGKTQYGDSYKMLPAADYKLAVKTSSGRSVYTFCMCPGGEVVASASEEGGVVTNGMSYFARDGKNANSALLVNVMPSDLDGDDVLEGCKFQRDIEKKAYDAIGGYFAPYQTVGDFLHNNNAEPKAEPSYKPGVCKYNICDILPDFITDAIREALPLLDRKLNGFADDGAVLTFPETRSSSPVCVVRDSDTLSSNIQGLYPCGEGAGYAGGIMTAAVDGIRIAEAIATKGASS